MSITFHVPSLLEWLATSIPKLYIMYKISCQNPLFLQNPKLKDVPNLRFCVLEGTLRHMTTPQLAALSAGGSVFDIFSIQRPKSLSYDFCEQFYAVTFDGVVVDFFVAVPCRCCSACRCSYVNSVRQRLLFELQNYRTKPLFVTLTYNDRHLPSGRSVNRRDVQLFLKRFRQFVKRRYNSIIRYYYVSEYTPVTKRPHYHLVIYGFPLMSDNPTYNQYLRMHTFQFCWREPDNALKFEDYRVAYPVIFRRDPDYDPKSFGFVDVVEMHDMKCVNYICKYMHKNVDDVLVCEDTDPLTGKVRHYRSRYYNKDWSRRNFRGASINLGVDFVRDHVLYGETKITFTDWLSRQVQELNICGYYIGKLYPSLYKLVPSEVRRAYKSALYECQYLINKCPLLPGDIRTQVLSSSLWLRNQFPFIGVEFDCDDGKTCLFDEVINRSLYIIAHGVSVVYQYVTSTDFYDLFRCVAIRDLALSKLDIPVGERSYTRFEQQISECLARQKLL